MTYASQRPGPTLAAEVHDPAMALLRAAAAARIRAMNAMHSTHAHDLRGAKDELSAHAVAFFHAETAVDFQGRPVHLLRTATRLELSGPDTADAARLLSGLAQVAARRRGPDPFAGMAQRADPRGPGAWFAGAGLSTLGLRGRPWADAAQRADGPLDVPGRGLVLFVDGSALIVERRANRAAPRTVSSHSLDRQPGAPTWVWYRDRTLPAWDDPHDGPIWWALADLVAAGAGGRRVA